MLKVAFLLVFCFSKKKIHIPTKQLQNIFLDFPLSMGKNQYLTLLLFYPNQVLDRQALQLLENQSHAMVKN